MRDPHTRESRGFAFVTMEVVEDADNAVAALAATEFMGRTLGVERARRARARTRSFDTLLRLDHGQLTGWLYSYSWTISRTSQKRRFWL